MPPKKIPKAFSFLTNKIIFFLFTLCFIAIIALSAGLIILQVEFCTIQDSVQKIESGIVR